MSDEDLLKKISENASTFLAIDNLQEHHFHRRCVLVQPGGVHEEIIPSVVYILNLLGFHVDVYLNQLSCSRKGNIFKFFKNISYRLFLVNFGEKKSWINFTSDVATTENYELLIVNTFQREPICKWLSELILPSICIIHNVDMFLKQESCVNYFLQNKNACPIFLARHVYNYAIGKSHSFAKVIPEESFIYPIYFEDLEAHPKILTHQNSQYCRNFVIQGTINYANRDYSELISAISEIAKTQANLSSFRISVVGAGKDKEKLLNEIRYQGIQDFFEFVEPEYEKVSYESYYERILAGDFLLPLISNPRADYLSKKISSSLMMVLGMKTIPIINSVVAKTYGIDDIQYEGKNLKEAMVRALNLDYASYHRLRLNIKSKSLYLLQESIKNMENALELVLH